MVWVTSDLHLGHAPKMDGRGGIIQHANRPFKTIEEHDEYLIRRWNETVSKGDTTYVLGDMCWKNHSHYIQALNGKIVLITGSHDKMSQLSAKDLTDIHIGMHCCMIEKQYFVMTHCAMLVWERSHYGSINLHGHSHGRLKEMDDIRRMDVGVDVSDDYAPFSLDFILYKMSLKKQREYNNNHDPNENVKTNKESNIELMKKMKESNGGN